MNIYLKLFLTFLQIGAFSFGGGYGMLSVIREQCLSQGWLTEEGLIRFIAIAESTPGPIAVNMATFVGSEQAGFWGALVATLGVVLPSFVIILLIAAVMKSVMKYPVVRAGVSGIQPVIIGLILTTGLSMMFTVLLGLSRAEGLWSVDYRSVAILVVIAASDFLLKKCAKKKLTPVTLILLSAGLGTVMFGILG